MNSNLLFSHGIIRRGIKLFQSTFFVGLLFLSGSTKAQPGGDQPSAFEPAQHIKIDNSFTTDGLYEIHGKLYVPIIVENLFE